MKVNLSAIKTDNVWDKTRLTLDSIYSQYPKSP